MTATIYSNEKPSNQLSIAIVTGYILLALLILLIIFGNIIVLVTVTCDRKLRTLTTNKFIASLAISDLLIGVIVMPLSLFAKIRGDTWDLGENWCTFHLVSAIFSTTASIVHLVAISLDRYFAIMFPTEYQRHSISTSALPYVIMIWLMSLAVSSTLFLDRPLDSHGVCWVEDPQYLVLSSFLSFFLPGAIVVYLYAKIYQKLRKHKLFMFGNTGLLKRRRSCLEKSEERNKALPEVIIEEVKSRRGSRMSQASEMNGIRVCGANARKSDRSPSQPEIHTVAVVQRRWRSPTICAETLEHNRTMATKKRVSIVADPPSMDITSPALQLTLVDTKDIPDNKTKSNGIRGNEVLAANQCTNIAKYSIASKGVTFVNNVTRNSLTQTHCILEVPSLDPFNHGDDDHLHELHDDDGDMVHPLIVDVANDKTIEALKVIRPVVSVFIRNESICKCRKKSNSPVVAHSLLSASSAGSMDTAASSATETQKETLFSNLEVPKLVRCTSPTAMSVPSSGNSTRSSASNSEDFYRRISMNSYNSSLTESDSAGDPDSRRSSTWSTSRAAVLGGRLGCAVQGVIPSFERNAGHFFVKKNSYPPRGKLRRLATQVTKAVRQKRRESMAMRRESRATRVVAAILIAFLICWIPYFCVTVYRGICTGLGIAFDKKLHAHIFLITSWLGYTHSCFNPIIYTSLNKSFRRRLRKMSCF